MDSELRQQNTNSQGACEGFLRCSLGSWGRGLVRMKLGTEGGGPGPGSWGQKPSGVSEWAGGRAERGLEFICRMWDAPGRFSRGCIVTLAVGGGEQGGYQVELRLGRGLLGGSLRWG